MRGGSCIGAGGLTHDPRSADRAVHGIRVHAPRTSRCGGAVARRCADRRVPDVAADESGRRCDGARDPARRGHRVFAFRSQPVCDDVRRIDRRLCCGDPVRRGRAQHRIERGRGARDLLSRVAGARRYHRVHARHQYRSAACAVRQYPGARRSDAAGDRVQRHHHVADDGGDLSPAGGGMRRSGVSAHREPRRRADASRLHGIGSDQSRQRLPCARHAAGGGPDDPARRHRAILVA